MSEISLRHESVDRTPGNLYSVFMSISPAPRVRVAAKFARKPSEPFVPPVARPFYAAYVTAAKKVSWMNEVEIASISYTRAMTVFAFVNGDEVRVSRSGTVKVVES